jgi:hypothetical protein
MRLTILNYKYDNYTRNLVGRSFGRSKIVLKITVFLDALPYSAEGGVSIFRVEESAKPEKR